MISQESAPIANAPPPARPKVSDLLRLGENETQPTIGEGGRRNWIYAREVKGALTRRRNFVAWILLVVYLGVPWLQWRGVPLVQVDVFARRLALFGKYFYPQDIGLFVPALLAFIVFVFLVTAKWGRVWCGWACPQTVFLQFVFAPLERWIEGNAGVRRRRDQGKPTFDWAWRKVLKQGVFLAVSALIGNTALAYFWGLENVLGALSHAPAENPTGFAFVTSFTLLFYGVFAFFKEQACVLICPYAKFQSVLLDERSLIVGYDARRGEPRGRAPSGSGGSRSGLGDCVDCGHCVQVCPTGIDIRKGVQLECIACTRCVDACDSIMTAWKKPAGLIRYASLSELEGKSDARFRKRLLVYGVLSVVLGSMSAWALWTRPEVSVDILRVGRNPYERVGEDSVLNTFSLNLRNKSPHRRELGVEFAEPFQGRHDWQGRRYALGSGQRLRVPFTVTSSRSEFSRGKRKLSLNLTDGKESWKFEATLAGPFGPGE
ncbi:MAG: ccoG [Fibrobacteria bacterium]|jgi:cytochrome c oxidase accessory protein FixG|nr:ccoG [Fibrobacteria bacterium]